MNKSYEDHRTLRTMGEPEKSLRREMFQDQAEVFRIRHKNLIHHKRGLLPKRRVSLSLAVSCGAGLTWRARRSIPAVSVMSSDHFWTNAQAFAQTAAMPQWMMRMSPEVPLSSTDVLNSSSRCAMEARAVAG